MTRAQRKAYIKDYYTEPIYGKLEHLVDEIYDDFEAELKQSYINGSNSCNDLIQNLYKQIEAKDEHIKHLQNIYMNLDGKYLKLKEEFEL